MLTPPAGLHSARVPGARREKGAATVSLRLPPPRPGASSRHLAPSLVSHPLEVPSSLPRDPYELHTSVGVFLCAEAKLAIFMRAVFPTALRGLRSRVQRQ